MKTILTIITATLLLRRFEYLPEKLPVMILSLPEVSLGRCGSLSTLATHIQPLSNSSSESIEALHQSLVVNKDIWCVGFVLI